MREVKLVLVACLAACGTDTNTAIPAQCNPLGGQGCMLPWPSFTYETADSSTQTGFRLDIPKTAMPKNQDDIAIDPEPLLNHWDGFSPTGPLFAEFPNGVSAQGLPGWQDPSESLKPDSPIVLLDMDTGERAPFFAEVDQNIGLNDPVHAALIIRPLARLHTGARYAVAIRNTVLDREGGPIKPSPAFQAILDGKTFDHPRFADLASRYDAIFAALATAGVDKSELVLAWDYTTASDQFLTSDLTTMKAAAVPAWGTNGASLSFTATEQPAIPNIYKSYLGTYKSPGFLSDGNADDSVIVRGADHLPAYQGLRDADFAALIPDCVATAPLPRPTIIFGHGIFGSAKEYLNDSFTQTLAEQHCFIIIAGDFIGLTSKQLQLAGLAVNDFNVAPRVSEKLGQSVIDFMSLAALAKGPMATSPQFQYNGQNVIDPAHTYYVGGSLGGIMGGVIMAYDPNLVRGVLAVPGGNWSMLVERSFAWYALRPAALGSYTNPEIYPLLIAVFGMGMEPYDPITTAAHEIKDPLPGVPAKEILMWYSMGDCLVTNISTEMVAREMGIPLLSPSAKMPWGMSPATAPLKSAINVFNAHPTPLPPDTNTPPGTDNGTHSGINKKPAALRFVAAFLGQDVSDPTADIVPECMVSGSPAACDCATGACD